MPNQADFESQFAAERSVFERLEGLREPQTVTTQRGHSKNGEFALYVASYLGKTGARYVGLFPLSNKAGFGMMTFITDSNTSFSRYSKMVAASFETLQLSDDAARLANKNLNTKIKEAPPLAVVNTSPSQGSAGSP